MNTHIIKSDKYYIEKYSPNILGGVISFVFFITGVKNDINFEIIKNIIFGFPAIGFTIFGFGLTLLSILIQGNSNFMINIRQNKKILFNRIINKNKDIVYCSLILSVYSYMVNFMYSVLSQLNIVYYLYIKLLIMALFIFTITRLFVTLFSFIKSFYLIIKQV